MALKEQRWGRWAAWYHPRGLHHGSTALLSSQQGEGAAGGGGEDHRWRTEPEVPRGGQRWTEVAMCFLLA